MKYCIEFLSDAVGDRDEIREYLVQYNQNTARKFFIILKERIDQLKDFPYSCPIYEDDDDYRKLVVGEYLVFYMIDEKKRIIEVYRILHGSRNIKRGMKNK